MTTVHTPRLLLRRARADDLDALHDVLGDDRVMRYWCSPPHVERGETERWLANMMASPPRESEDFVIEQAGCVIGKVGAYRLPDFGYILRPDRWGQGLAYEAAAAFVRHALARPDVPFLTADIDPRNTGSLRLIDRLGFRETGRASRTWHTHIGWCDSIYFRVDRDDLRRD